MIFFYSKKSFCEEKWLEIAWLHWLCIWRIIFGITSPQSSSSSISHKALVSWLINIFCNIALFLTTVLSYSVANANKVQYNVCKLVIQVRSRNESAKSCMITMNKAVSFPNCMCTPVHPTSNKVYVTFSNHSQTKVRKVSVFTELSLTTWLSSFRLLTSKQNIYQTFLRLQKVSTKRYLF